MVKHRFINVGPTHFIRVRLQPVLDILDPQDRQPRLFGELLCEIIQMAQLIPRCIGQPHGNINLPALAGRGGVLNDKVVALILRLARGAARPCLLPVKHCMNTRVRHDWSQCIERALNTCLWATRANIKITPDHQPRDRTADMFGVTESIKAGHQIQFRQNLARLHLEKVLALE